MSHASKQLLRSVMAIAMALGLTLPAIGGTLAQEEDEDTTSAITIEASNPSPNGPPTLGTDPPGHEGNTNDLRGKILRISVNPDGSYIVEINPPGLERNTNDLRGKILRITPTDDGP